jgi:hypothetical protein
MMKIDELEQLADLIRKLTRTDEMMERLSLVEQNGISATLGAVQALLS